MFNPNNMNTYLQRFRYGHLARVLVIGFCVLTGGILFFGALPAHGEVELADAPLFTQINPPPTNLMILQDDSGSMTFEILVRADMTGNFPNPDSSVQKDSVMYSMIWVMVTIYDDWRHMGEEGRKYWRSQWYEVNAVYYNPASIYEPWPSHAGQTFLPADTNEPLIHPLPKYADGKTLDLDEKALKVGSVTIPLGPLFCQGG